MYASNNLATPSRWHDRWGILGTGRLGSTLALALASLLDAPLALSNRGDAAVHRLMQRAPERFIRRAPQDLIDQCDWIWLCVPDDQLRPVTDALRWRPNITVVHCSGASDLSCLDKALEQGARVGSFHPLQLFGDLDHALASLAGCTIAVDGDPTTRAQLSELALALSCHPIVVEPQYRVLYHAGASYAAGFVTALMAQACVIWEKLGLDEMQTRRALMPLLTNTVSSLAHQGLTSSMAGPLSRGDRVTLERHLNALAKDCPQAIELYRQLSLASLPVVEQQGRIDAASLQALSALLSGDPPKTTPQN